MGARREIDSPSRSRDALVASPLTPSVPLPQIKDGAAGVSNCNFHWNDCDIAPRFGCVLDIPDRRCGFFVTPVHLPDAQTKRRNHEDRVADKDIKYRPNVANICPRPKDWKPGKYQSKGVDGVDVNYPRIDERNRKYWGSAGGSHAKTFPSDE